jgi:hypothetical protein
MLLRYTHLRAGDLVRRLDWRFQAIDPPPLIGPVRNGLYE